MILRIGFTPLLVLALLISDLTASSPTQISSASGPKFTSLYTDMRRDCRSALTKREEKEAEDRGQDIPQRCKGFGGYYILLSFSAVEEYLSAVKTADEKISIQLRPRDSPSLEQGGGKIEWRLANGRPFAAIVRFTHFQPKDGDFSTSPFDAKNRTGESLIVVGLKGYEQIYFEVDAKTPDANQKAREMADNAYLKKR